MFSDAKALIAGGVCLVLGLLAGGVSVSLYDAWFVVPDAERAATDRADARWKDAVAAAQAKAAEDRRTAEAKIAEAERAYVERDAARAAQMTALEQALEQEMADAPIPSPADRSCVCRPTVTRGLRDALQGIGRAGPGAHPAKPDAAVRRGQ